jgi:hypothetical protein
MEPGGPVVYIQPVLAQPFARMTTHNIQAIGVRESEVVVWRHPRPRNRPTAARVRLYVDPISLEDGLGGISSHAHEHVANCVYSLSRVSHDPETCDPECSQQQKNQPREKCTYWYANV